MVKNAPEIWLVGGYGDVGLKTARHLSEFTDARVVLAGRDADKAKRAALGVGASVQGAKLDITESKAAERLSSASFIVSFTEEFPPSLVAKIVKRNQVFVDTSANPDYADSLASAVETILDPKGLAVLGAGLAPGLTGVLARGITMQYPETRGIDIVVEMGMGRRHGHAGTRWTIENLAGFYPLKLDGSWTRITPGTLRRKVRFANTAKDVSAIGFGFSDQVSIARDLELDTVRSFLALDPPWATQLLGWLAGSAGGRVAAAHTKRVLQVMDRLPTVGGVGTRLLIEGFDNAGRRTSQQQLLSGGDQAQITAIMVAATVMTIMNRRENTSAGLVQMHRLIDAEYAKSLLAERLPKTAWY